MIEAAWLAKLPASVRAAGRSILRGFEEHGWSGKLFMLMTAGTTLVPLLGGLAFVLSDLGGRNSGFYGAFIFVFMLPFVLFQLRVLLGIARFESWARWLAMLGCTFGILTGLGSLAVIRGPQFWFTKRGRSGTQYPVPGVLRAEWRPFRAPAPSRAGSGG